MNKTGINRIMMIGLFIILLYGKVTAQDLEIILPNKNFMAEVGTGIDTRLKIKNGGDNPVYLNINAPEGITAIIQPDTLSISDSAVISIIAESEFLACKKYKLYLQCTQQPLTIEDTICLNVIPGDNHFTDNYFAIQYRDTALKFIVKEHPEIIEKYGNLMSFMWTGFYTYPQPDVVSHYVFLAGNWRMNVMWHVMVPPYNWKKIFVYNEEKKVGWGINLDTDNIPTEIPCEKHYYFNQDTNAVTSYRENSVRANKAMSLPNPFLNKTRIQFSNPNHDLYDFYLFDINGKRMRPIEMIQNDHIDLYRENLEPGIYFYQLRGKNFFNGKLIVQ